MLSAPEEKALIKQLAQYPVVVQLAARDYDPSFINRYLTELAAAFHKFYNACRIKGEAENVLLAAAPHRRRCKNSWRKSSILLPKGVRRPHRELCEASRTVNG